MKIVMATGNEGKPVITVEREVKQRRKICRDGLRDKARITGNEGFAVFVIRIHK